MPATITFKAKTDTDCLGVAVIRVPKLKREHCDMHAMRKHPKLGAFANSDMFASLLANIRAQLVGGHDSYHVYMSIDPAPEGVIVDTSGFLASVSITVPDNWDRRSSTLTPSHERS